MILCRNSRTPRKLKSVEPHVLLQQQRKVMLKRNLHQKAEFSTSRVLSARQSQQSWHTISSIAILVFEAWHEYSSHFLWSFLTELLTGEKQLRVILALQETVQTVVWPKCRKCTQFLTPSREAQIWASGLKLQANAIKKSSPKLRQSQCKGSFRPPLH